jgi:hypothetical protein
MTEATDVIWEAQSETLTGKASGGRIVKGRYRLTREFLFFETGTLRTDAQQVPIAFVKDVDVKQSITQKARGVGNVIVHIEHLSGRAETASRAEKVTMESIGDPKGAQRVINDTAREARHELQARSNTMNYNQNMSPGGPMGSAAAQPAATAPPDPMAQLKQLGELREAGVLSDAEFDAKKSDILSRM